MSRKGTLIRVFLIVTIASSIMLVTQSNFAFATEPAKLKIYVGPTSVPADNNIYKCVFVQLQDSSSKPARALQDTIISLSSSQTSVGTTPATITIAKGETFAVADFQSSFTPGATTIAATASGYATVQTSLRTEAPVPYKLALYGFPSILPADALPYDALVVQLQDSSGNPAKAPLGGITVTLSSSNSTIASVPASVAISGGQTYSLATTISNTIGSATITALTSGYITAQTTITSQEPSTTEPKSLRIYVAPPKTLADNFPHSQIFVQLLNGTGKITRAETAVSVQLTSSNENIGTVEPVLEIPAGGLYTTGTFSATYKAGSTTITAAATDLIADTETLTTTGPTPTKLAVYCTPSALPADNEGYSVIQVQLQDASGKPALDPDGDVTILLFSSQPSVGSVPTTLTIPFGKTYATTTFTSTFLAGSATVTAQASGYSTGTATMKTYLVEGSSLSGEMQLYIVDVDEQPVSDVTVVSFEQPSGMTTLSGITNGSGYLTFQNVIEGNYSLSMDKQGYTPRDVSINFKTNSTLMTYTLTKPGDAIQASGDLTIVWLILIPVIAVVAAVVFVIIRRRRTAKAI
jgi:hypothetical protein